jgi:hypothetical protein
MKKTRDEMKAKEDESQNEYTCNEQWKLSQTCPFHVSYAFITH